MRGQAQRQAPQALGLYPRIGIFPRWGSSARGIRHPPESVVAVATASDELEAERSRVEEALWRQELGPIEF